MVQTVPHFVNQNRICVHVTVEEVESACKVVEIQPQIVLNAFLNGTQKQTAILAYLPSMISTLTAQNV